MHFVGLDTVVSLNRFVLVSCYTVLEPLILLILPIPNPWVYFYILFPQMAWLPFVLLLPYPVTGNLTHIGLIVLNYLEGPFSGGSTSRATLVKAPSLFIVRLNNDLYDAALPRSFSWCADNKQNTMSFLVVVPAAEPPLVHRAKVLIT